MDEIFWIEPGKLAGRRYPSTEVLKTLFHHGFRILVPLEVRDDIDELEELGYVVHPFWVRDFTAPTIEQLEQFNDIVEDSQDKPILVHCLGGYGRTGTMLGGYLIRQRGLTAGEAIAFVRGRRPGAVEAEEQIARLYEYEAVFRGGTRTSPGAPGR